MSEPFSDLRRWSFRGWNWSLGEFPKLMGILNVTPDSFSDGGTFLDVGRACEHAVQLVEQGADLLDIGGESTRPGSQPISEAEELRRVIPVLTGLAGKISVPISIDTTKARVAEEALQAGAHVVNDISGLRFDPRMIEVCAEQEAGVICMHIQGTPQTMQVNPTYENVVEEVRSWLSDRVTGLTAAGISRERIVLDPGIGFGKTAQHNLEILTSIARFRDLGHPVLIGHSRKGFLKKILGRDVNERMFGTVGIAVALAMQHLDLIRVHDVQATRDTLQAWAAVATRIRPADPRPDQKKVIEDSL